MKQRRFKEEQIIRILKEQEAGVRTADCAYDDLNRITTVIGGHNTY